MPIQAFWANAVKKRCVIKFAENFKNDMTLRDSVFPFSRTGSLMCF